jgi:hypothetical protein
MRPNFRHPTPTAILAISLVVAAGVALPTITARTGGPQLLLPAIAISSTIPECESATNRDPVGFPATPFDTLVRITERCAKLYSPIVRQVCPRVASGWRSGCNA